MTSKTRTFIELSDIVALSFECKSCGTTVSFDLEKDFKVQSVVSCYHCGELWARTMEGGTIELTITKFVNGLKDLKLNLQRWQEKQGRGGFHLFLELNPITVRAIEPTGDK